MEEKEVEMNFQIDLPRYLEEKLNKNVKEKNTLNHVLKAAQATNDAVRKNRDWENMKGRAVSED